MEEKPYPGSTSGSVRWQSRKTRARKRISLISMTTLAEHPLLLHPDSPSSLHLEIPLLHSHSSASLPYHHGCLTHLLPPRPSTPLPSSSPPLPVQYHLSPRTPPLGSFRGSLS